MAKRITKLTADLARALLSYDPETGELRWKERPVEMFVEGKKSAEYAQRLWNAHYAGEMAGTSIGDVGYYRIGLLGRIYLAHRVIWLLRTGRWPAHDIDHVNGIRHDNRWVNLREATRSENHQNRSEVTWGESGLRGAYRIKKSGRWKSAITVDKKEVHIGVFDTAEEAHQAYLSAKAKYHPFSPMLREVA